MDIRDEIVYHLKRRETTGALLLIGKWGCGKSHLAKEIARKLNNDGGMAITVISLFGLDSVSAINSRIGEEYIELWLGTFGNRVKKAAKAIAGVAKEGTEIASIALSGNSAKCCLAWSYHGAKL